MNEHLLLHQARQAIYVLLQRLYIAPPEEAFLAWLKEERPFDDLPVVLDEAALQDCRLVDEATQKAKLDELKADFHQLYIGYGDMKVPQWESVYRNVEKDLFDAHTLQVREVYARHGMEFVNKNKTPEDSVGIELEFMKTLTDRLVMVAEKEDENAERVLVDEQLAFLNDHLLVWIPEFVAATKTHAQTTFYRALAGVLIGFLNWDQETLVELQSMLPEAEVDSRSDA